jgi:hypothetical protein
MSIAQQDLKIIYIFYSHHSATQFPRTVFVVQCSSIGYTLLQIVLIYISFI